MISQLKSIFDYPILFLLILSFFHTEKLYAKTIRVGVYDNPPKVITSQNRKPSGIFIDIIEFIAKKENWHIEYVSCTWQECLKELSEGKLDLVPDAAISAERKLTYNFNRIPVLDSWLQIFSRKDVLINSIYELNGKRVAVLDSSIQQKVCKDIFKNSDISFTVITLPDYKSTCKKVELGEADAFIADRFYGYSKDKNNSIIATPLILNPSPLHIIAAKGHNSDILNKIDTHLAAMMNNPNSVYYESLNNWLHKKPALLFSKLLLYCIIFISIIAAIFITFSILLNSKVNSRTKELQEKNNKLQLALAELDIAHREAVKTEKLHMLGQIASGIVHDLNNLLTPILIYSDFSFNTKEKFKDIESVQYALKIIQEAALHGKELISRMQNFCRNNATKNNTSIVNINDIINEVLELTKTYWICSELSSKKKINIIRNFGTDINLLANKTEIHEMILNLLLNSAYAISEHGIIEIKTDKTDIAIIITIKDNGCGMSEEIYSNCLQPFFTTKGEKGTGMGLSMVNSVVRNHGGKVEITSKQGHGTTFTLTFPINTVSS